MYNCPLKKSALEAPHLPCIIDQRCFTFQEIDQLADTYLEKCSRAGISISNTVAFHPSLSIECIALLFALWRLKANIFLINPKIPQKEIPSFLKRTSTTHFIHNLSNIECIQTKPSCFDTSLCLLTSGSTGTPKIAVLSLKNLLINASHSLSLHEKHRYLLSLPLFHVGGLGIILRSILAKAAIVLDQKNPLITHISYVPTHLYRSFPLYKHLECVLLGGAPIGSYPENLPIHVTYGLTEMGSMVLLKKKPPSIDGLYYLGAPLFKREVHIHTDGEIWVKGECLFQGYLEHDALTLPLNQEGWFQTKDIGQFHPEYGITIIGRKDWQFISGGENIQPEEIEKYIKMMPEIEDVAVVPKKDAEFGEIPIAFAVINKELTLASLQSYTQDFLPNYKIPKKLVIVSSLPKTGIKIDRQKLIEIDI